MDRLPPVSVRTGHEQGVAESGSEYARKSAGGASAEQVLRPLLSVLFGDRLPVRFEFWDGSELGPEASPGTAVVRSPMALRRMMWAPGELGIARAFVAGELDFDGDGYAVLRALHDGMGERLPSAADTALPMWRAARQLGVLGPPPPPPASEIRLSGLFGSGGLHSKRRDSAAVTHHYDVGNDFYRLVLGPSMTYSCARFEQGGATLEEAQRSKHELICRKLGLSDEPGRRLLDVGCGWGSMAMHAAAEHGAYVVGITLSPPQVELARARVEEASLADRVEIKLLDYRELRGERFDAISSIGMFEHVGRARMAEYFSTLFSLLRPRGRLLNHAISSTRGTRLKGRTFMNRYVFPDGELLDVADVSKAMEGAGLELRDVESLREHYAKTLRHWVANLESRWDEAVALVGAERARVWRLYMSASVNGFEDGHIAVHQVLGVRREAGESGMPATRTAWS